MLCLLQLCRVDAMGTRSRRRTSTSRYTHVLLLLCTTHWTHVCLVVLSRWNTHCHCRSLLALLHICHVYVCFLVVVVVYSKGMHKIFLIRNAVFIILHAVPLILGVSAVVGYFVIYDSKRFELVSNKYSLGLEEKEMTRWD